MASLKTLAQLIEITEKTHQEAAQNFAQVTQYLQQNKEKLDMLNTYRAEYETRMRQDTLSGMHGTQINNYSRFIAQLTQAIQQQEVAVQKAEQLHEHARLLFLEQEKKLKSFQTLQTREQAKLDKIANKRDQKLMDEYASRRTTSNFLSR